MTAARKKAVASGKRETDNRCIMRGTKGGDGAHLFSAGDYPALADLSSNIFCISRDLHSTPDAPCFDFRRKNEFDRNSARIVRPVSERIWILQNLAIEEFRDVILTKLFRCELAAITQDIAFPEPVRPNDLESLLRGIK